LSAIQNDRKQNVMSVSSQGGKEEGKYERHEWRNGFAVPGANGENPAPLTGKNQN
jgi:hypothetical protein